LVTVFRIGTRGSPLALWQAHAVAGAVARAGGPPTTLVTITTSGDRLASAPLSEAGGKRLFVKEIEDALLDGTVDVAVHSAKDMPAALPPGLIVAAALPREDPRDAFVLPQGSRPEPTDDPNSIVTRLGHPRVGTGSIRRISQLAHVYTDARFEPIRGNVGTRLRKLDEGGYDLLVLATAGLIRLELANRITVRLPVELCMPAPGQGIVAIESRVGDEDTAGVLAGAGDAAALVVLTAERAYLTTLGGGCQVPVGGLATIDGDALAFRGVVAEPDGARLLRRRARGALDDPAALGDRVARELLADGADEILTAFGV
jgi:hydroxymethylbilane synthase